MKTTAKEVFVICLFSFLVLGFTFSSTHSQTELVPTGSSWKYLDDGSNQGTAWRETGFDDGAWSAGPAQLGYGDGDEATVVGFGPDPNNKYITTYFRHTFTVGDHSLFNYLRLRLLRDDGAVVYLNGYEIERSNMNAGPIDYLTTAASGVGGADENTFFESYISPEHLVSGTNVLAVEIHQWDGVSSDISFDMELTGIETALLIATGSTWKYLDDGSNQGTAWRETGFDDGAWSAGPAQLGYGDGDEATVVGFGPDPNNKYITTYFRHTFTVGDHSLFNYLQLRLLRDDGAVVYLNGYEIERSNMNAGPIDYLTVAASGVDGTDESTYFESYMSPEHLLSGTNVLAVEIHQWDGASSDISFDMELSGLAEITHPVRKTPYLIYTGNNREMQILWQLIGTDTCHIEWGLDTSYSLGGADTYEYGTDHQHSYTIMDLQPQTQYFYRVTAEADTISGSFWAAPYSHRGEARFFAYGDTRTYPADHNQVAAAILAAYITYPSPHSMIISVGDLISNGDIENDWDTEFFNLSFPYIIAMLANIPYQTCIGNHEGSGVLFTKYFPYPFESGGRYWSFDYGPAHFVMVDQYVDYSSGSTQYNWIVSDLSASTKPWKFMYLHEPGWSAGGHENNLTVQNDIQPLCELFGVSILFAGHNHYYARAEVNGIQHITTGGGGAPLYAPNPAYPNIVTAASEYHYCDIWINDGVLTFAAVSAAGDTLDQFTLIGSETSIDTPGENAAPREVALHDAYPNPFNPITTISIDIPRASHVNLAIYDVTGRRVRTLFDNKKDVGKHTFSWDGRDDAGKKLSTGIYFCRLRTENYSQSRKILLLK